MPLPNTERSSGITLTLLLFVFRFRLVLEHLWVGPPEEKGASLRILDGGMDPFRSLLVVSSVDRRYVTLRYFCIDGLTD